MTTKVQMIVGLVSTLIVVSMILSAAALEPPTPFKIYGWVSGNAGNPVYGPTVTIEDLNTSEVFCVATAGDSNHYHAITSSWNVSVDNVFHIYASDGSNEETFNHTVLEPELLDGGLFALNITVEPPGVCGDVDGLPGVTTNDGRQIFMYLLHGEEQYPLVCC
ncbi:hypothetical protein C5S31_05105 [ANME-1 cluster archaeon GoMg2]|nr:hypothetical protein [ANME-1 cluster archaeon GoMg2]